MKSAIADGSTGPISSNCLVIYGYLPKHEKAGSHALSAWNGVLFLRRGAHKLEQVLGDP